MTHIGTKGTPLFAEFIDPMGVIRSHVIGYKPSGKELRDTALAKSSQGRKERIEAVRHWLVAHHFDRTGLLDTLTADDVHDAVDALGFGEGDTRWLGSILRSWKAVTPTVHFVASRRPSRSAAPHRVWRWV